MAITKSAKKAIRGADRKHIVNVRRKRALHDVLTQVQKLVRDHKGAEAEKLLAKAYQAIDKAKKGGILHTNTAARRKSKIAKLVGKKA